VTNGNLIGRDLLPTDAVRSAHRILRTIYDINLEYRERCVMSTIHACSRSHQRLLAVVLLLMPLLSLDIANAREADSLLIEAAYKGDLEKVRSLLNSGVNVNARKTHGTTALTFAAERGHTQVVKLLLDKGADVNAGSASGRTALMGAAEGGHPEVLVRLFEKRANINSKDFDGRTALTLAAERGHTQWRSCCWTEALM
jgi:uncharacterized protein